jgi:hypothetical protein
MVGGERIAAIVRELLQRSDRPLDSLTDSGFVETTRLAVQSAQITVHAFSSFADVPLAATGEPSPMVPTFAQAVGAVAAGDRPLLRRQAVLFRGRVLLVVGSGE